MLNGGADRDRTGDLMNAIHALYQLSYSPKYIYEYTFNFCNFNLSYQTHTLSHYKRLTKDVSYEL